MFRQGLARASLALKRWHLCAGETSNVYVAMQGNIVKYDRAGHVIESWFTGSGFSEDGTIAKQSPCNTRFQVELSNDDTLATGVVTSGFQTVSATAQPQCYGTWTPSAPDWTTLSGTTGDVRVFYRIRTQNAASANEKISTQPGNGSFTVPPPYVIVNNAGQP